MGPVEFNYMNSGLGLYLHCPHYPVFPGLGGKSLARS
jgi:hypothetical protein